MKVRLSEVPIGSCYLGKKSQILKKVDEGKASTIALSGRVSTKRTKGDPEVEMIEACPLKYLGIGLRRHPDLVVEIGDGNILKKRRRS
jgi:hypothetical protein